MHKSPGKNRPSFENVLIDWCLYLSAQVAKVLYSCYHKTLKIQVTNERLEPARLPFGETYIYIFWHSKSFTILPRYRHFKIGILTLLDLKNRFYDRLCGLLGYQTVPVTSEMRATIRLKQLLEAGFHTAIAIDGPKGPAGTVRPGALYLSEKTGRPVIAVRMTCDKAFRIRSRWDQYEIPRPFSTVTIQISEPMTVSGKNRASVEAAIKDFLGPY